MDRDDILSLLADGAEISPEVVGADELAVGPLVDAIIALTRADGRRASVIVRDLTLDGDFDLSSTSLPNAPGLPDIEIRDCEFTGLVDLSDAQFGRLSIKDCGLSLLLLEDTWVRTSARFLRLRARGDQLVVKANRFRSGGDFDFSGSHLVLRDDADRLFVHDFGDAASALMFRDAVIGGNVVLDASRGRRFIADGGVMCTGAKVEGEFSMTGARLVSRQADALRAKFTQIGGTLALTTGFHSEGRITIASAQLRGGLEIKDAILEHRPASFRNDPMVVLEASNATVGGSVDVGSGTVFEGAVNLSGASVSGAVSMSRATFAIPGGLEPPGTCLRAVGAKVGGSVLLGHGTVTRGDVDFSYAEVGGAFRWDGLTMLAAGESPVTLRLDSASVGRGLEARELDSPAGSAVSLRGLRISSLDDALEEGWGRAKVELDGLFYEWVSDRANLGWRKRDDWLVKHTQHAVPFNAQPFAQYAASLQRSGNEEASRLVILSAEKLETRSATGFRRFWRNLYGLCFGYGLRPRNALITISAQIGVAALLTIGANNIGWMTLGSSPVKSVIGVNGAIGFAPGTSPGRDPPCGNTINPLIYAADVVIPLLDLREEAKCDIVSEGVAGTFASLLKALFAIFGWIVTSLVILTCSGAIRRLQG